MAIKHDHHVLSITAPAVSSHALLTIAQRITPPHWQSCLFSFPPSTMPFLHYFWLTSPLAHPFIPLVSMAPKLEPMCAFYNAPVHTVAKRFHRALYEPPTAPGLNMLSFLLSTYSTRTSPYKRHLLSTLHQTSRLLCCTSLETSHDDCFLPFFMCQ